MGGVKKREKKEKKGKGIMESRYFSSIFLWKYLTFSSPLPPQHLSGNLNESPTTTTNDNHINITNTTPETIISCSGGLETSEGEEGDLIIVDDRVMRRGVGWEGEGGEGRVMGWVRYSRPWFKSGGGGRSVFESVNFSV